MIGRKFSGTGSSLLIDAFVCDREIEYINTIAPHRIASIGIGLLFTRPFTSTRSTSCACRRVHARISPCTPPDIPTECPELLRRNPWFRHTDAGPTLDPAVLE